MLFLFFFSFLSFQQQCQQEPHEEYRGSAQDNGEIGMQVDAWKMPQLCQRNPCDDYNTEDTAQECSYATDLLRNTTQEEESEHTS